MPLQLPALAAVLVSIFSISFGASLAKKIFPVVGPDGATSLRLLVAAIILCAIWKPWKKPLSRKERKAVITYGVALGMMNLSFYAALERIPLGITVALEFLGPLSVALWSSRSRLDVGWAVLAILGVYLILPLAGTSVEKLDPIGILYALGAGLGWALYIIFGQRAGAETHAGLVTAWGMLTAAVITAPFGIYELSSRPITLSIFGYAVGIGIFSSAIPYSLEMFALKRLPAKNFGILMSLEPAVAAFWGLCILGEHLTSLQWMAMGCVMIASVGSSWTRSAKAL